MHMLYEYQQIHIVNYDELQEHYMSIKVGHVSYASVIYLDMVILD